MRCVRARCFSRSIRARSAPNSIGVRGTLARDEALLARARGDSARFAGLAKDGYVTKQQLDQAFADATALAATVAADRAALQRAQLDLENTTIRAPISGRTGQLAIKAGNLVRAQADPPLVTINELRPVLVRFSVPERDFCRDAQARRARQAARRDGAPQRGRQHASAPRAR